MEQSKVNWKQILATALVTGSVTVGTGMLLFTLQRREPRLVYTIKDTVPFSGDKETLGIYQLEIKNDGNRSVKDVIARLNTGPANIREHRFTGDPSLQHSETVTGNTLTSRIPSLNPREEVTLSVLASGHTSVPLRPSVALRGDGILGHEALPGRELLEQKLSFATSILSALAGVAAYLVFFRQRIYRALGRVDQARHYDDQNHVLAYLLGLRGQIQKAEEYLARSENSTFYWSEADRITARALADKEPEAVSVAEQLLRDLLTYADMNKLSEGIVHYNLARLAKQKGEHEKAREELDRAERRIPKLLKARLKLDPLFPA